MPEYFFRQTDGGSKRIEGPYATEDEARRVARYKGLKAIEILTRSGQKFVPVGSPPPGAAPAAAGQPKSP